MRNYRLQETKYLNSTLYGIQGQLLLVTSYSQINPSRLWLAIYNLCCYYHESFITSTKEVLNLWSFVCPSVHPSFRPFVSRITLILLVPLFCKNSTVRESMKLRSLSLFSFIHFIVWIQIIMNDSEWPNLTFYWEVLKISKLAEVCTLRVLVKICYFLVVV